MSASSEFRVTGRHVLITMLVFFGVIIAVQATFITFAARTFPGLAVEEPFRKGLAKGLEETRAARAEQRARGWRAGVAHTWEAATGAAVITVSLSDAAGDPITGLDLQGELRRIVTDAEDRPLALTASEDGGYRAELANVGEGEWELILTAAFPDGAPFEARRRLWMR